MSAVKKKAARRPAMKFGDLGLKPGKVIRGSKGGPCQGASVIIIDDTNVCLIGQKGHPEVTSLAVVTANLVGKKVRAIRPLWSVGRKTLNEVYEASVA